MSRKRKVPEPAKPKSAFARALQFALFRQRKRLSKKNYRRKPKHKKPEDDQCL